MARPLRIERIGGRYHVTARGNDRQDIFRCDADRYRFLELLSELLRTFLRSYFLRNWRRKNAGFLASAVVKIAAIVPFEQATIWWIAVLGWFSDRTRNLAELKSYAEFGS